MGFKTTLAVLFVAVVSVMSHAQEFSADVVYLEPNGSVSGSHPASKIYVSKENFRLETNGFTGTVLLVNRGEQTAFLLQPKKKTYQPLATGASEYFRAENPEDACGNWQNATTQKIDCKKVGDEAVNGRDAVHYENTSAGQTATSAVWIDKALKFVTKWKAADAGAELRNIKEGQQTADLFTVPSDYKQATPQKGSKGFSHR